MRGWQAIKIITPQRAGLRMLAIGIEQIMCIAAAKRIAGDDKVVPVTGVAFA
jgi:hypothetical protein